MHVNKYPTLIEAVNALQQNGYNLDFKVTKEGLVCIQTQRLFLPSELKIIEFHRFEGDSSEDDMSIIYAIETDTGEHGTVIDAFGTYSDENLNNHLKKIKMDVEI